jgi:hypothetical protein
MFMPSGVSIDVGLDQVGLAHLLDKQATARKQLHQPGDDRLQQHVQFVVCGCARLDEAGHAIGAAPVHAVQHQAERKP